MKKKNLIIHIPVLHRGYLDFFKRNKDRIASVYLLCGKLFAELTDIRPDIASLDTRTVKKLLTSIGLKNIFILSGNNINRIKNQEIVLIQDEISRNLYARYLSKCKIEWVSVFLRWDKKSITTEVPVTGISISKNSFDIKMMRKANEEAQKSSDWWRQVGAVLVKNKEIILRAYNQGIPNDHSPYQVGAFRDFFKAGEREDLVNTIHAEQKIIVEAAKKGIRLQDTVLYLTHFPCYLCSKLIAFSGIKTLYFNEGASTLDGKKILELTGIEIIHTPLNSLK